MAMITEKGTLPVGIEKDGKYHRDFEIRPAKVRDTIDVADEQESSKLENGHYFGLCVTAKQILRIGGISPVTPDDLMDMLDDDFHAISAAKERLAERLNSFHEPKGAPAAQGAQPDAKGTDQGQAEAGPRSTEAQVSA